MFRLIEPSSGQIQTTVLVHSVSAQIMGSHTVYKQSVIPYCAHSLNVPILCFVFGLMMAQWAETCRRICNIDYQYILCLLTE
jgi:uncharacterized membrane protein YhfC